MKRRTASLFQLVLAGALALSVTAPNVAVAGPEDETERPKVEFIEVEGSPCLYPLVKARDVKLADFRAAALRWLTEKYPGSPIPRWQTELVTEPISLSEDGVEPDTVTIQRESAHVVRMERTVIVCFDIDLTEPRQQPRE